MNNAERPIGKCLPNLLSGIRVPLSLILLLFPALSGGFLALYLVCCLTDALDGFLARRLDARTELGARLDSAADFVLVAVLLWKLWPVVAPDAVIVLCTAAVALVRIAAAVTALLRFGTFGFVHTRANQLTGVLLALYPLILRLTPSRWPLYGLLVQAGISAVEELIIELCAQRWEPDRKGLYRS